MRRYGSCHRDCPSYMKSNVKNKNNLINEACCSFCALPFDSAASATNTQQWQLPTIAIPQSTSTTKWRAKPCSKPIDLSRCITSSGHLVHLFRWFILYFFRRIRKTHCFLSPLHKNNVSDVHFCTLNFITEFWLNITIICFIKIQTTNSHWCVLLLGAHDASNVEYCC